MPTQRSRPRPHPDGLPHSERSHHPTTWGASMRLERVQVMRSLSRLFQVTMPTDEEHRWYMPLNKVLSYNAFRNETIRMSLEVWSQAKYKFFWK